MIKAGRTKQCRPGPWRPRHIPRNEWADAWNHAWIAVALEQRLAADWWVELFDGYLKKLEEADPLIFQSEAYRAAYAILAVELPKMQEQTRRNRSRLAKQRALERLRLPLGHPRAWKRSPPVAALCHQRRQFAVGQGGFHAGALTLLPNDPKIWKAAMQGDALKAGDFVYVYDCGSEPADGVRTAAREFARARQRRPIDMLFLSHLDRDHICGVPELLSSRYGVHVDTIVLPYLDDLDRLITFSRSAARQGSANEERFHRDLTLDPVGTLRRFDPRQIIFIRATDDEGPFELRGVDPPTGGSDDGVRWKASASDGAMPEASITEDGAIVLRRADFVFAGQGTLLWHLKPYVRCASREDREAFQSAVEIALDWPRGSFGEKTTSREQRRSLVTRHRTVLARAYKWAFKDKNETSLSLYSGPANPGQCGAVFSGRPQHDTPKVGWLGTGDAYLNDPDRITAFERHYCGELEQVSTFVLPHHGSIHNSDPARLLSAADLFVACAQPIHSHWRHPDPILVQAIRNDRRRFRLVSGKAVSELVEKMVVFTHEQNLESYYLGY